MRPAYLPVLLDEPVGVRVAAEHLYSLGFRHRGRDFLLGPGLRVVPPHRLLHRASSRHKLTGTLPRWKLYSETREVAASRAARAWVGISSIHELPRRGLLRNCQEHGFSESK